MQKTKKQHYVPQSYLKAWAIPGTYQVHVYDKKTDKWRTTQTFELKWKLLKARYPNFNFVLI